MTRKVLLPVGTGILLIVICGVAAMRWATRQAPDFYETALASDPSPAARHEAARKFAEQTARLVHDIQYAAKWREEFSQSRVNAWLADELPEQYAEQIPDGVSDPRVQFEDGLVRFGFRLSNSRFDGIVSLAVRPAVTGPNRVAITVESLSAGLLPLTPAAFTDDVSEQLDHYDIEHNWEIVENKPVLHLTIVPTRADHPVLEELDVDHQRLRIAGYRVEPRALTMRGAADLPRRF